MLHDGFFQLMQVAISFAKASINPGPLVVGAGCDSNYVVKKGNGVLAATPFKFGYARFLRSSRLDFLASSRAFFASLY